MINSKMTLSAIVLIASILTVILVDARVQSRGWIDCSTCSYRRSAFEHVPENGRNVFARNFGKGNCYSNNGFVADTINPFNNRKMLPRVPGNRVRLASVVPDFDYDTVRAHKNDLSSPYLRTASTSVSSSARSFLRPMWHVIRPAVSPIMSFTIPSIPSIQSMVSQILDNVPDDLLPPGMPSEPISASYSDGSSTWNINIYPGTNSGRWRRTYNRS